MMAAVHQWGVEAHEQILQPISPNEGNEEDVESESHRYRHHLQHLPTSETRQQQQGECHGEARRKKRTWRGW